jgi:hypothetical protein
MIDPDTGDTYAPTPSYFLGAFDVYDREEELGEELEAFDPNDPIDREVLILVYCLRDLGELGEFSYRKKLLMVSCLETALLNKDYDFQALLEDDPEEFSSFPSGWDTMENPRLFFEDILRLANEKWKDDLQKASMEDQSTW